MFKKFRLFNFSTFQLFNLSTTCMSLISPSLPKTPLTHHSFTCFNTFFSIFRSWNQLFVVLSNNQLMFFKDSQTAGKSMQDGKYNSSSRSTFKGEAPLPLKSCTIEVANDYTKRSNVFRLKLSAGAEYLFQAQTTDEMNMWVQNFKAIQAAGEVADDDTVRSKICVRRRNLVILGHFQNNFRPKNRNFQNCPIKRARRASRQGNFENFDFFILKTSKNDQIEVVGHTFLNAL